MRFPLLLAIAVLSVSTSALAYTPRFCSPEESAFEESTLLAKISVPTVLAGSLAAFSLVLEEASPTSDGSNSGLGLALEGAYIATALAFDHTCVAPGPGQEQNVKPWDLTEDRERELYRTRTIQAYAMGGIGVLLSAAVFLLSDNTITRSLSALAAAAPIGATLFYWDSRDYRPKAAPGASLELRVRAGLATLAAGGSRAPGPALIASIRF